MRARSAASSPSTPSWYRPRFYVFLVIGLIVLYGTALSQMRARRHAAAPSTTSAVEERLHALERLDRAQLMEAAQQHPPVVLALAGLTLFGLTGLLVGGALDVRWLWRWRAFRDFLRGSRSVRAGPWHLGDVARFIVLALWWVMLFPLIERGYVAALRWQNAQTDQASLLVATTYLSLLLLSTIVLLARAKGLPAASGIGLPHRPRWAMAGRGLVGYVMLAPCLAALLIGSAWVAERVGYEPPTHPLTYFFLEERRWGWLGMGAVMTCLLVPFIEEVMFRALLFPALRTRLPFWQAAALSGLLFGALHTNWVSFLPIAALGVLLAYLVETTGSLYASVLVHAIHNSVMVALMVVYRLLLQSLGS